MTTDPELLGIQSGGTMADPRASCWPTVELLEAAGADMRPAGVRQRFEATGVQYD
ncbi:hypothetical protein [Micromonospora aurantiaca (nom. illeg.)]|uniref:hypothetical protein n=1 Tax=Micromonospora aurantiaca (nom. illeg.) TaxID=47850 RepID=UPI003F49CEF2